MSTGMVTLHEIAVKHARKQKGMVDSLTEEAPILDHVKWKAASHGLWNVAERLTNIEGPAFVAPDAPLPQEAAPPAVPAEEERPAQEEAPAQEAAEPEDAAKKPEGEGV